MIELKNLTKKYNDFTAVDGLELTINTGEFFGLLGPNGAGKTTTISMLSTVLLPTEGSIYIDGELLTRAAQRQKRKLSVVTQEYSMRQDMTVEQVMEYQGRLYFMPKKEIREKTEELLRFADLWNYRTRTVRHLSGGMKRKLMVCRALMVDPEILILDEPTAGMDALARRQMWQLLRRINEGNLTIILTTHYMEEAETLCDRVALINKGRLGYVDTPRGLIDELGGFCVEVRDAESDGQSENSAGTGETAKGLSAGHVTYSRYFSTRQEAIAFLQEQNENASLRVTTLEDVFVERMKQ